MIISELIEVLTEKLGVVGDIPVVTEVHDAYGTWRTLVEEICIKENFQLTEWVYKGEMSDSYYKDADCLPLVLQIE